MLSLLVLGILSCSKGETRDFLGPPQMLRLEISPAETTAMGEDTVRFVARAVWSDGSTTEPSVTWTASSGVFLSKGLFRTPRGKGKQKVIATIDSAAMSDTATVTVVEPTPAALVRLSLAPSAVSLQPGGTQQFAASGTWADSSSGPVPVTYTATGGTISAAGLYTAGTTAGTFRVVAVADSSPLADTSAVTISATAPPPPALVSIALTPGSVTLQSGQPQAFAVTGSYSDGTKGPTAVTYTATGGTISSTGVYTAGTVTGNFRVIAQATGGTAADTSAVTIVPTLVGCTVSPAAVTLNPGQTQQFTVVGNLSNGTTTAVQVTWTATGGTITASGLYTAGNVTGKFLVTAAVAATAISCSGSPEIAGLAPPPAPVLTAVEVTPSTATLAPGATQSFSAVGRMSDNSTTSVSVTWSATGGTVSSTGSYTAGNTAGTFRVIAVQQGGSFADTAVVTITSTSPPPAPALTSLSMSPASVSLAPGGTQLFAASALWSDGSTTLPALTWSATGGTITAGLYTAGSTTGTFRAIVSGGGKADTSTVDISAGPPTTGLYANRPTNYTTVLTDYPFDTTPPPSGDASMGDGSIWHVVQGSMTRVSDPAAPASPSNVLQWTYNAGGTSGTGVGLVYATLPTNIKELYVAFSVWHDANFEWNSISNKLFYWEDGNIILQSRHFGEYLSLFIGAFDVVYDPNFYHPTIADFNGKWANIEYQIQRGNPGRLRVWLNGRLVSDYSVPVPAVSGSSEIKLDSTWGGSTSARTRDSFRRVDHIVVATP